MRTVAIIQARMSSTRLPGKVMEDLCGKAMLWHIIKRVKRAKQINQVIIACPGHQPDLGEMFEMSRSAGCLFSAPEVPDNDLIGRYFLAARAFNADLIVRICSDNPFVDPAEIDRAVEYYMLLPKIYVSNMHQHRVDFISGGWQNGYPDGIGCEVFSMSRLKWMHETIKEAEMREHPHLFFHTAMEISSPTCPPEISRPDLRLDVNTQADLDYVRSIYEIVYPKNQQFTTKEAIDAIDTHHLERREVPA